MMWFFFLGCYSELLLLGFGARAESFGTDDTTYLAIVARIADMDAGDSGDVPAARDEAISRVRPAQPLRGNMLETTLLGLGRLGISLAYYLSPAHGLGVLLQLRLSSLVWAMRGAAAGRPLRPALANSCYMVVWSKASMHDTTSMR
ncbi:hypothetical protein F4802DRAFT_300051 [Xylaria palmicola]|nr:hypothetical protein F4802DRAFT_300051 [Xylaria palmicola]